MPPLVSVIVPTFRRPDYLPLIHACFQAQTYPNLELLVHDDSEVPSTALQNIPNVRCFHSPTRLSIGQKRNFLAREARGSILVHFDDDDYYAPNYVAHMVAQLGDAAVTKLSGWYTYGVTQQTFAYWDTAQSSQVHFLVESGQPLTPVHGQPVNEANRLGYGFSYVYRKSAWQAEPFPDQDFGEDYAWMRAIAQKHPVRAIPDAQGLALHIIHGANTSRVFPQYVLPPVLLDHLFGPAIARYIAQ